MRALWVRYADPFQRLNRGGACSVVEATPKLWGRPRRLALTAVLS